MADPDLQAPHSEEQDPWKAGDDFALGHTAGVGAREEPPGTQTTLPASEGEKDPALANPTLPYSVPTQQMETCG